MNKGPPPRPFIQGRLRKVRKKAAPTILPGNLAEARVYNDLSDQDILHHANYHVASAEMIATALNKDFLKRENPHDPVIYAGVPELIYT